MEKKNGYKEMLKDLNISKKDFYNAGYHNIIGLNDKDYIKRVKEISRNILDYDKKGKVVIKDNEEYRLYYRKSDSKVSKHFQRIREELFHGIRFFPEGIPDSRKNVNYVIKCIDESDVKIDTVKRVYFQDYDLSHIWDATQNPLLYSLPWNYYFIPKIIAPITDENVRYDHENKEFLKKIMKTVIDKFDKEIEIYNKFISSKSDYIIDYYQKYIKNNKELKHDFKNNFIKQFYTIDVNNPDNLYKNYLIKDKKV